MTPPADDAPALLRRRVVLLTAGVTAVFSLAFVAYHASQARWLLSLVSASAVAISVLALAMLRRGRSHRPVLAVLVVYSASLTLALLASGWFPAGDFVWCLLVPPLITYAGGLRLARWLLPPYLLAAAAVVLRPGFANEALWARWELAPRFLGVLALTSGIAVLYEHTRSVAQSRLRAEVQERRAAEAELEAANARLADMATRAERLAADAQAANEAKTRFLSHMSHDIRTPLTGIVGMTSVLEMTPLTEQQRRYVETIRISGDTLTELIGDILDLARIEAGRVELAPSEVALRPFLDDALRVLEPQARKKGLTLEGSLSAQLPERVLADPRCLRQVLLNLGGNAVKFTERGRVSIALGVRPDGDPGWWRITVTDTGVGIAPDQHRRIFESFTQVDLGDVRRDGGSGLGLAICGHLVAMMGGELDLSSEEGSGATFWVDLPLERAEADGLPGDRAFDADAPLAPLHLLLVDDSEIVRRVICGLLGGHGHTIDEAPDGLTALERLATTRFDAVVLDVQLPGLDGIELTRRLRAGSEGVLDPLVPVLGVTAMADATTRKACLDAGMNEVLTKPVQAPRLLAGLARVVTGRG